MTFLGRMTGLTFRTDSYMASGTKRSCVRSPQIFLEGDSFEMCRIDARLVPTPMVDLKPVRDRPDTEAIRPPMRVLASNLSVVAVERIPFAGCSMIGGQPNPTAAIRFRFGIRVER